MYLIYIYIICMNMFNMFRYRLLIILSFKWLFVDMFHCYVTNVHLQSLILVDSEWPFWVMGHPQVVWPLQTDMISISASAMAQAASALLWYCAVFTFIMTIMIHGHPWPVWRLEPPGMHPSKWSSGSERCSPQTTRSIRLRGASKPGTHKKAPCGDAVMPPL